VQEGMTLPCEESMRYLCEMLKHGGEPISVLYSLSLQDELLHDFLIHSLGYRSLLHFLDLSRSRLKKIKKINKGMWRY